jgi:uncharacterized membrane protein YphA (DoxX/SURF4 family)
MRTPLRKLEVIMMNEVATSADRVSVAPRTLAGGLAVLRIMLGAIWLSNGLAKVFLNPDSNIDWGFATFNLINQNAARSILQGSVDGTFQPLRAIYGDFVLGNWEFFGWFLAVAEVVAGVLLILGIASRFAPLIGLGLLGPIWIMQLNDNHYLWELPIELIPLLVLVFVPTGRMWGQDGKLAERFGGRWPF